MKPIGAKALVAAAAAIIAGASLVGCAAEQPAPSAETEQPQPTQQAQLEDYSQTENRLARIYNTSDHSGSLVEYDPQDHFETVFETVEGQCLAEALDKSALADFENAVGRSIEKVVEDGGERRSRRMTPDQEFDLGHAYSDLGNDEALAKTAALYQQIEDAGCLIEGSAWPEMIDGWND